MRFYELKLYNARNPKGKYIFMYISICGNKNELSLYRKAAPFLRRRIVLMHLAYI